MLLTAIITVISYRIACGIYEKKKSSKGDGIVLALLKHDLRIMRSLSAYSCSDGLSLCMAAALWQIACDDNKHGGYLVAVYWLLESLLAVERNCRWDRYVLTMPIARETVVREKYCLMLLAAFLPCLAGMCMDGLFYSGAHLFIYLFLLDFCGLLLSFIGPIYLKKANTGKSALAVTVMMVLCGLAAGGLSVQEVWFAWRWLVLAPLSIITIAALLASYHISLRIYQDKEF